MSADVALSRLRDPEGPHVRALARLTTDSVLDAPVRDLAPPAWLAHHIAVGMKSTAHDADVRAAVLSRIASQRQKLSKESRTIRAWLPAEAEEPARRLLSVHWSPSEDLTFRIINHPALRTLVREILRSTLTRFTGRLKSLDQGVLGGLGGRAVRRGKGLFGSVADGIVGAVREEMSGAVEGRIKDFLGTATEEAVRGIASWIADPAHAESLAAMRLSALDVCLDTPLRELAREAESLEPAEILDIIMAGLDEASSHPDVEARLQELIGEVLSELGHDTLRPLLVEFGILDMWQEATVEWLASRVAETASSEAFESWWETLHA